MKMQRGLSKITKHGYNLKNQNGEGVIPGFHCYFNFLDSYFFFNLY